MKSKIQLFIILFSLLFSIQEKADAQAPNCLWAKGIIGSGSSSSSGKSITIDSSGNAYTTGSFIGTVDFDPGASVFNLTSTGSSGYGNVFISKLDASGNFVWTKTIDGTTESAISEDIAVDDSGNVLIAGYFGGTLDFDPGVGMFNLSSAGLYSYYNAFILKLDSSGNFIWAKALNGTGAIYPSSIAFDALGNIYTTGGFAGVASSTYDFDPGVGVFNLTNAGNFNIFISKLDASGNFIWAKGIGGSGTDYANAIAIDNVGSIYITGSFGSASADFDPGPGTFNMTITSGFSKTFILKLDIAGNFIWAKNWGGGAEQYGTSIAIDGSGNAYTCGTFYGPADFDPGPGLFNMTSIMWDKDIFISKLDGSGNFVWAKQLGGTGRDYAYSLALDASGNVYSTGKFRNTADFDPNIGTYNLTADSLNDIFISKLDGAGNFVWAKAIGGLKDDICNSIDLDSFDNVLVTGNFKSTSINFDSTTLTNTSVGVAFISKFCQTNKPIISSSGATSFCQGDSITLSSSASISYLWSNGATTQSIIVSTSGYDSVTVTNSNGCSNTSSPIVITVNPFPIATITTSNSTTFCEGDSITLTSSSATSYQWSNGATTQSITVSTSGNDSVTVTNSNGCTNTSSSITITAFPLPIVTINLSSIDTLCFGSTIIVLNGESPLGGIYSGAYITGNNFDVGAAGIGTHLITYTYTDANMCTDSASGTIFADLCTTITNQTNNNAISLYPNPATDYLTISFEDKYKKIEVSIFDITGKLIYQTASSDKQQINVNTKDFAQGIYVIQIQTPDFVETKKLVIAK